MYNSETKGSQAYFLKEEFMQADEELDAAQHSLESAVDNAIGIVDELNSEIDEKDEEISDLEIEIKSLKKKFIGDDREKFIQALRNIQVYIAEVLKTVGEPVEPKRENTDSDSGDRSYDLVKNLSDELSPKDPAGGEPCPQTT